MILFGSDSNRWVTFILGLLLLSFFVSCNPETEQELNRLSGELQSDGYGHIDDTVLIDVTNEPLTCEELKNESVEKLCSDGKIWVCHVPPGNPLNSHMIKISIGGLNGHKEHKGEVIFPCSDEYQLGQNCPIMDCDELRENHNENDKSEKDDDGDGHGEKNNCNKADQKHHQKEKCKKNQHDDHEGERN